MACPRPRRMIFDDAKKLNPSLAEDVHIFNSFLYKKLTDHKSVPSTPSPSF